MKRKKKRQRKRKNKAIVWDIPGFTIPCAKLGKVFRLVNFGVLVCFLLSISEKTISFILEKAQAFPYCSCALSASPVYFCGHNSFSGPLTILTFMLRFFPSWLSCIFQLAESSRVCRQSSAGVLRDPFVKRNYVTGVCAFPGFFSSFLLPKAEKSKALVLFITVSRLHVFVVH